MNGPERYRDDGVLSTYAETQNVTIYCHGPIGTSPFEPFFNNLGTRTTLAYVKPFHWKALCNDYIEHTHILILRDPEEAHRHAAYLHGTSMREVHAKRENMFYQTHLQPYLSTLADADFDFYIPFDKLSKFLLSYETPKTTKELFGEAYEGPIMFDIEEERMAYKYITDNKMELNMTQWRQLLITGQLGEI
jgi:hypothetical protein|tara:strand:- start:413 stop:985 length:573 start_codon:yes stop_codon:yes gene_type:complete